MVLHPLVGIAETPFRLLKHSGGSEDGAVADVGRYKTHEEQQVGSHHVCSDSVAFLSHRRNYHRAGHTLAPQTTF